MFHLRSQAEIACKKCSYASYELATRRHSPSALPSTTGEAGVAACNRRRGCGTLQRRGRGQACFQAHPGHHGQGLRYLHVTSCQQQRRRSVQLSAELPAASLAAQLLSQLLERDVSSTWDAARHIRIFARMSPSACWSLYFSGQMRCIAFIVQRPTLRPSHCHFARPLSSAPSAEGAAHHCAQGPRARHAHVRRWC